MRRAIPFACAALALAQALAGCATLDRVGRGMGAAAKEPMTWAPLAAGAVLAATDADQEISDWARQETPLFGSTQGAIDASDTLLQVCEAGWLVATLTAPAATDDPFMDKVMNLGVGFVAVGATGFSTDLLKDGTGRMRPDGFDDRSFPSGHGSRAGVTSALGMWQAEKRFADGAAKTAVDAAFLTAAFGTGWARVEAGKHYPSDVLAGYALGRWLGRSAELAFLDADAPVALLVTPDGLWLSVSW